MKRRRYRDPDHWLDDLDPRAEWVRVRVAVEARDKLTTFGAATLETVQEHVKLDGDAPELLVAGSFGELADNARDLVESAGWPDVRRVRLHVYRVDLDGTKPRQVELASKQFTPQADQGDDFGTGHAAAIEALARANVRLVGAVTGIVETLGETIRDREATLGDVTERMIDAKTNEVEAQAEAVLPVLEARMEDAPDDGTDDMAMGVLEKIATALGVEGLGGDAGGGGGGGGNMADPEQLAARLQDPAFRVSMQAAFSDPRVQSALRGEK